MKTFTDANGVTWTVALTIDVARRVKSLLGVVVLEVDQPLAGDLPQRRIGRGWCLSGPLACYAFRETFTSLGRATTAADIPFGPPT